MENKHGINSDYEQALADGKIKGGLRKIANPPPPPCRSPEHDPPRMIVLEPGTYEYTCPLCGKVQIFTVPTTYC